MNIDKLSDTIIAKSRDNIAAILKSELEKIKIRDLKELKADTIYYNYDIEDADYDCDKEWMKDKPASIKIIYAFISYYYRQDGYHNNYTVNSTNYWYITDRGLTICIKISTSHDSNYLYNIEYNHNNTNIAPNLKEYYNHLYSKSNIIKINRHNINHIDAWKEIEIKNDSLPILPITWYKLIKKTYTIKSGDKLECKYYLDELTNYYEKHKSCNRELLIIYLCEMARNAAKIPHIDDLALAERLSIDNEIDMRRIRDDNAILDKRRQEFERDLLEFHKTRDEQYEYFRIEREKLDNQHKIVKADLAKLANYNNVTDFHYLYKKVKDIISYSRSDINDPNLRKQLDEIESIIYKK